MQIWPERPVGTICFRLDHLSSTQEREKELNRALVAYLGAEAAVGEKKGLGCFLPCPTGVLQESPRSACTLLLLGAGHWAGCWSHRNFCQELEGRAPGEQGKGNGCVARAWAQAKRESGKVSHGGPKAITHGAFFILLIIMDGFI